MQKQVRRAFDRASSDADELPFGMAARQRHEDALAKTQDPERKNERGREREREREAAPGGVELICCCGERGCNIGPMNTREKRDG